jgi:glycyl-tRNA synthetase
MDAIMALCKRRGFIFQASDIYGGINGFWDYGPLGAQMKKNLREAWWQDMILNPCWGQKGPNGERVKCVPVETRIIQHPKVWEASGHVGGFNDPMQDCKSCKARFRSDHLDAIYSDSKWFRALEDYFSSKGLEQGQFRASDAFDWSRREGKKLAPNLQLVKSSPSTKPSDPQHVDGNPGLPRSRVAILLSSSWYAPSTQQPCPVCGGELTEPRQFNLMFSTYVGATATEDDKAYLRPETAQGVFLQFKNVVDSTRVKIPFGIGNTGTSFRNEVTPRNFTFRSREFEQAELEFFCHPSESFEWYKFWRDFRMAWWKSIGLAGDNLILREHDKDELSHYSVGTSDVEYRFPFTAPGFGELEGIAHRGDYDLTQHQKHSGTKLDYFDTTRGETLPNGGKKGERYMPHCIEPAAGLDRGVLALLCEAYTVDPTRPSPEFLKLHPRIAPIKAAIFPLMDKDGLPEVAEKLYDELFAKFGKTGFIEMDAKQSIGKRYARMDEAGCPYCFTIDQETLTQQTVTVRDRDTGKQERIALSQVSAFLSERLGL